MVKDYQILYIITLEKWVVLPTLEAFILNTKLVEMKLLWLLLPISSR